MVDSGNTAIVFMGYDEHFTGRPMEASPCNVSRAKISHLNHDGSYMFCHSCVSQIRMVDPIASLTVHQYIPKL